MTRDEMRQRLAPLKSVDGVRLAKVACTRDAIESGVYEDSHKLDVAVDRLLDDLEGVPWRLRKVA